MLGFLLFKSYFDSSSTAFYVLKLDFHVENANEIISNAVQKPSLVKCILFCISSGKKIPALLWYN